ncbi:uncharacterized protein LOC141907263 [Tubulanus polymorphus]|uniref:uncharacterized protein LOC141907263 n=1 Tax=Tubulanus polymorphus TaxID=672921 RepID=UPI003DA5E9A6
MLSSNMRRKSYSRYLAMLAVTDQIVLSASLIVWLNFIGIEVTGDLLVIFMSRTGCLLVEYVFFTAVTLSTWIICVISLERLIAVNSPLAVKRTITPRITNLIMFMIVSFSCMTTSYVLFLIDFDDDFGCYYDLHSYKLNFIFASSLLMHVPASLVFIFNVSIIAILKKKSKFGTSRIRRSEALHATLILSTVSVMFLVMTLPLGIAALLLAIRSDWKATLGVIYDYGRTVYCINFAINFYIYLTGREVREALLKLIFPKWSSKRRISNERCISSNGESGARVRNQISDSLAMETTYM